VVDNNDMETDAETERGRAPPWLTVPQPARGTGAFDGTRGDGWQKDGAVGAEIGE
jgi:hypothetical protein